MNEPGPHPHPDPDEQNVPDSSAAASPPVPEISSEQLLQGSREIRIRHGEETYRLRLTKNDKLILHK